MVRFAEKELSGFLEFWFAHDSSLVSSLTTRALRLPQALGIVHPGTTASSAIPANRRELQLESSDRHDQMWHPLNA
jgi:hypothetical protein